MSKASTRSVGAKAAAPQKSSKNTANQFKKTAVASSLGVCLAMMAAPSVAATETITGVSFTLSASNSATTLLGLNQGTTAVAVGGISLLANLDNQSVGTNATISGGSGSVTATTSETASIVGNTIDNYGAISVITTGSGISVKAEATIIGGNATANTTVASAAVNATATSTADASITGNFINNYGSINSPNGVGIDLSAFSYIDGGDAGTTTVSGASASATATAIATASASISGNTIGNFGVISIAAGTGISLSANASIDGGVATTVSGGTATANSTANALISGNTIENFGSIYIGDGSGISLFANADVTDSIGGAAIAAISGNTINNYGSIVVDKGDTTVGGDGISLALTTGIDSTTVVGGGSESINGNRISNIYGGRIIVDGTGININDSNITGAVVTGNTITNSGLIVSDPGLSVSGSSYTKGGTSFTPGTAINIEGAAGDGFNVLNISAPAYIAGEILLKSTANVKVQLTSGPSHSVLWSIKDDDSFDQLLQDNSTEAILLGSVPWFSKTVNGTDQASGYDVYATIDPSAFAAAPNMLGDLSGMVSSMARVGLEKNDLGRGLWLAVQGGERTYEGDPTATMQQKTTHAGVAIGYAHRLSEDWRVSGMIGANQGRLEVGSFYSDVYANSFKNKADGGFIGLHFAGSLGPVKMNLGISGGANSHKDRRFVNDNLKWWGISNADSKYDSAWLSPEIGFAIPIKSDSGWSVTPSLSWRYSAQDIDGFTETGLTSATANAKVASRTLGVSEANLGLDITRAYGTASSISGKLGYLYRTSVGDKSVKVDMIGDSRNVPFFYKDLSAGIAGIDWKQHIAGNVSFYLNANYIKGNNVDGGDVSTGLKVDF